ncbi:MAG TPA: methionyl-tRNA formyltransferase, partial [Candidatus Paceibacterota bacterium]|nr:methionyl-tRNA formyltransferase [Candidatus Paceibacterota bacterium]
MNKTAWAFFGTDEFAVGVLSELQRLGLTPGLIVTAPDTPQGRKLTLVASPVKTWALQQAIPTIQPASLKAIPVELASKKWDFFALASYGKIIPASVLSLPAKGSLNIHPSLLPLYRGSSPLQTAILNGDLETGVTLMLMDDQIDHGPIIAQEKVPIANPSYEELRDLLAAKGASLMAYALPDWLNGKLQAVEQDHGKAVMTRKVAKQDGLIDINADPVQNDRKIRAYSPWPGTFFFIEKNGRPLRIVIKKAVIENGQFIIERVIP